MMPYGSQVPSPVRLHLLLTKTPWWGRSSTLISPLFNRGSPDSEVSSVSELIPYSWGGVVLRFRPSLRREPHSPGLQQSGRNCFLKQVPAPALCAEPAPGLEQEGFPASRRSGQAGARPRGLCERPGGNLAQALRGFARLSFGLCLKNETEFHVCLFNAGCSRIPQYHLKYLNFSRTAVFLACATPM